MHDCYYSEAYFQENHLGILQAFSYLGMGNAQIFFYIFQKGWLFIRSSYTRFLNTLKIFQEKVLHHFAFLTQSKIFQKKNNNNDTCRLNQPVVTWVFKNLKVNSQVKWNISQIVDKDPSSRKKKNKILTS